MRGGRSSAPAVASHVRPTTRPHRLAALPITDSAGASETDRAGLSFLSTAYANSAAAKPACQKIKSHDPVWTPAPRSPVGENAPRNNDQCCEEVPAREHQQRGRVEDR